LQDTLAGIRAAYQAGLTPVKINTVLIRGLNDDETVDLALKSVSDGWHVRYIEWMPVGDLDTAENAWSTHVVTSAETRTRIEDALGPLEPAEMAVGGGPARYYRLPGARGTIGFVSPLSEHFCGACNRLRLTADGQLRPCLLSDREIDLRTPLRTGAGPDRIRKILEQAVISKPSGHHLNEGTLAECDAISDRAMAQIGG
jgi:cyclic pyranopterin phosphate synthase